MLRYFYKVLHLLSTKNLIFFFICKIFKIHDNLKKRKEKKVEKEKEKKKGKKMNKSRAYEIDRDRMINLSINFKFFIEQLKILIL